VASGRLEGSLATYPPIQQFPPNRDKRMQHPTRSAAGSDAHYPIERDPLGIRNLLRMIQCPRPCRSIPEREATANLEEFQHHHPIRTSSGDARERITGSCLDIQMLTCVPLTFCRQQKSNMKLFTFAIKQAVSLADRPITRFMLLPTADFGISDIIAVRSFVALEISRNPQSHFELICLFRKRL